MSISFVKLCKLTAADLGCSDEDAEKLVLAATGPLHPTATAATAWSSAQRSIISSVGKFEADGGDVMQWLTAFETCLELTCGAASTLDPKKVHKLLYSSVSSDVQRFLDSLKPVPASFADLTSVM